MVIETYVRNDGSARRSECRKRIHEEVVDPCGAEHPSDDKENRGNESTRHECEERGLDLGKYAVERMNLDFALLVKRAAFRACHNERYDHYNGAHHGEYPQVTEGCAYEFVIKAKARYPCAVMVRGHCVVKHDRT